MPRAIKSTYLEADEWLFQGNSYTETKGNYSHDGVLKLSLIASCEPMQNKKLFK